MQNTAAGCHFLDFSRADNRAGVQAVFVLQGTAQYDRDDFHIIMRVHFKAPSGFYNIIIDDAEVAETHELRIIIVSKRKTVITVEPFGLSMAAFVGRS